MTNFPRTLPGRSIGRSVLAVAIAGAGSATPLAASVWSSQPCQSCPQREMPNTGGQRLIGDWDIDIDRAIERIRKSPFEHYSHNPDDLRARPLCPPYCSPYGGYFEPNWRQMPPMPEEVYHESYPSTMIYGDPGGHPGTGYYPPSMPEYPMAPPMVPSEGAAPPAPPASPQDVFPEEPPAAPPGDEETFLPPVDSPAASRDQPYLRLGAGPALSSPADPF